MTSVHRVIFFLALALCGSCQKPEPEKNIEPPNIIFIETDDLTAKYLGSFGAEWAKTPNIDCIASNGVLFENAVVQGTSCTPSRNSLITSLYPHNLNLYENEDLVALPKGIWTFPKALQQVGYKTIWVGKNHLLPDAKGLNAKNPITYKNKGLQIEMGFDNVYQTYGRSMVLDIAIKQYQKDTIWKKGQDAYADFLFENNLLDQFMKEGYVKNTTLDPDTEAMDGYFTSIAIDRMKLYKDDGPFFLWLNFTGPHPPFNVNQKYHDLYNFKDMPSPINSMYENYMAPNELKHSLVPKSVKAMNGYRKRYAASIASVDAQVGRILDYLNNAELTDNTVIVFFSDHGIMTGDHGTLGKYTLYKEVLNPALIISHLGNYTPRREQTAMELIDLGKTVLEIAGANETTLSQVPSGSSLLPLLDNSRSFEGPGVGISELKNLRSIFNGEYKYIDHPETPLLFNLKENPDETENRMEQEKEVALQLKNKLDQIISASQSNNIFPENPKNANQQ